MPALLVLLMVFAPVVHAIDCPVTAEQNLNLVYPAQANVRTPVDVSFSIHEGILRAHFAVKASHLNVKETFAEGDYPYQFDVVELFLSTGGANLFPYYEFEVTPLNQTLQVKVVALDQPFINGVDMGLRTQTTINATGWAAEMQIPLAKLNWDGHLENLVGNAFAIQGTKPNRTYWSLYLPPLTKPRFHQPQFFKKLCH